MTLMKKFFEVTNLKLLGAVAAFASLLAIANQFSLCFIWFHQPVVPDAVRMMRK